MDEQYTEGHHAYVAREGMQRASRRFRLRLAALLVAIAPLALPFPLAVRFYFQFIGVVPDGPGAGCARMQASEQA